MRRLAAIPLAVFALSLILGIPAATAKGVVVEKVDVGEGEYVLVGADLPKATQEDILAGILATKGFLKEDALPESMGRSYAVVTTISTRPGGKDDLIEQELYPFTEDGPIVFTPADQKRHVIGKPTMTKIADGYRPYPQSALAALEAAGLEDSSLAPVPERETPPIAWAILGGSVVLAGLMFYMGTRKRTS